METIFLAHPVTDYQASDGKYRPEKKEILVNIIKTLTDMDINVKCAAINENYGEIKLEPEQFTEYDIESIKACDRFILFTSERLTSDMYLEIGIAHGCNKNILLIVPASAYRRYLTFMILGLEKLGMIKVISYDSERDIPTLLNNEIRRN
jgi:hypothetical protein